MRGPAGRTGVVCRRWEAMHSSVYTKMIILRLIIRMGGFLFLERRDCVSETREREREDHGDVSGVSEDVNVG